jgi:hypothetical protein
MKKQELYLLEKHAQLKQIITNGMEKTFPAYFFNAIGCGLVKVFRLKNQPPWPVNACVLGVLLFLPGLGVAIATKEIFQWKETGLFILTLGVIAYLAPIVSHINLVYNVLPGIRDDLVDSIISVEDLHKLHSWLNALWSFRKWMVFIVSAGLFWTILIMGGLSGASGGLTGLGILTLNLAIDPFFVIPFYFIFHMLTLPFQLAGYRLNLYESDPANSEVIQRLISMLNVYIYILAGYIALLTAFVSLSSAISWIVYVTVLFGWIPTTLQFLINQYAIRKIIIRAKWQNLNHLQIQIREIQNTDLRKTSEETIIRLNQLMDLHDRISAKPNSILNLGTGLSFMNQLLLPVLGWFLGNLDKLLKLLTRTP